MGSSHPLRAYCPPLMAGLFAGARTGVLSRWRLRAAACHPPIVLAEGSS